MKDLSEVISVHGREKIRILIPEAIIPVTGAIPMQNPQPHAAQMHAVNLPPIVSCSDFLGERLALPPQLIHGILHQGSKLIVAGGSKSYKTWVLLDLGISVALGHPWIGFPTTQALVLYINFEIQKEFVSQRIRSIVQAKGLVTGPRNLDLWNLRGYSADFKDLMPKIKAMVKDRGYGLIIIDPVYKGLGDNDENSAAGMGSIMNEIESLAVESGAAVVFGAHFSKGNQAKKDSMDRISGSGVFARDPDSILTLTQHKTEHVYTADATLRNFAPIAPFCIKWEFPMMVKVAEVNPFDLKILGKKEELYPKERLLEVLGDQKLKLKEWFKQVKGDSGMGRRTFDDKKAMLLEDNLIVQINGLWQKAAPPINPVPVGKAGWAFEKE